MFKLTLIAFVGMMAYSQAGVVPAALPYTAAVAGAPLAYTAAGPIAAPLAYTAAGPVASPLAYTAAGPVAYSAPLAYSAPGYSTHAYAASPVAYAAPAVAAPVAYNAPVVARAAPVAYSAPVVAAAPAPYFARAAVAPVAAAPAVIAARAAPVVAAPAPVVAARIELDSKPEYTYAYSVNDALTGDAKAQEESRDGDIVRGSYSLIEPDGVRRTVQYYADPINGFNAVVHRDVPVAAPVVAAPAKVVAAV